MSFVFFSSTSTPVIIASDRHHLTTVLDVAGRAAVVSNSARCFLAGLCALFVSSNEVDRHTEAFEELERLAGPEPDDNLDMFVTVLSLDVAMEEDLDVDGDSFRRRKLW